MFYRLNLNEAYAVAIWCILKISVLDSKQMKITHSNIKLPGFIIKMFYIDSGIIILST